MKERRHRVKGDLMPELRTDELRNIIDPNKFDFKTTETINAQEGTIGQDRAVHAISFSLKVKAKGHNLFVSGPSGTGKHSTVENHVREIAKDKERPNDWCYVYNFERPDAPIAIELPAGTGVMFKNDITDLLSACKFDIPRAFESEEYEERKNIIVNEFQDKRDQRIDQLRKKADKFNFSLEITAAGIFTFPIIDEKPIKHEDFDKLSQKDREIIKVKTDELQADINHLLTEVREVEKTAKERLATLDKEITLFSIGHHLEVLLEKYKKVPKISAYLMSFQKNVVESLDIFKDGDKKKDMVIPGMEMGQAEQNYDQYNVNLFIDNSPTKGAPVVTETNPSYYNIFGRLEYKAQLGAMSTDFTMLKPGSLHKANGGYLIINALELLTNPFSWDALKRALESDQARIENIGDQFRVVPAATLQPEPIPLDIKIILIGSPFIYNLLFSYDEDFRKFFRVKADFNWEIKINDENLNKYIGYIATKCKNDKDIRHFDASGVAKMIEYGSRLVDDRNKLSSRFFEIDNLLSESSFWAEQEGDSIVSSIHVKKAIAEKIFRSNLIEEKLQEMIDNGTIIIDTEGSQIGQINGLSIYELGDYYFGKPSRITCNTFVGKNGVVNIEREVKLGGPIHNKGVLILSGYLGSLFATDKPITMSATVTFEQLYSGVEGDSASSAELYSILSSLSGLPIKQSIAVTGSVNQKGEIQPIGGVNQKIEGFFDVCKTKGLNGDQGVMIPARNKDNLMLKEEVLEAVEKSMFHIWIIDTIDEGIEILTDTAAGARNSEGYYPNDTVNWLVNDKLDRFGKTFKRFLSADEDEDKNSGLAA